MFELICSTNMEAVANDGPPRTPAQWKRVVETRVRDLLRHADDIHFPTLRDFLVKEQAVNPKSHPRVILSDGVLLDTRGIFGQVHRSVLDRVPEIKEKVWTRMTWQFWGVEVDPSATVVRWVVATVESDVRIPIPPPDQRQRPEDIFKLEEKTQIIRTRTSDIEEVFLLSTPYGVLDRFYLFLKYDWGKKLEDRFRVVQSLVLQFEAENHVMRSTRRDIGE